MPLRNGECTKQEKQAPIELLSKPMPPKRKADTGTDTITELKKCRSAIDNVANEYVCPITQELPVDPVTAEDGRVYERSAIKAWLARPRPADQPVKSPVTNEQMGPRLLPAVQVRNSIKAMVQSGVLSGSKADAWRQQLAQEEEVAKMRQRANGGDGAAAMLLGGYYLHGNKGLAKDEAQAFQWFKRGADLGNATAMNCYGYCYAMGKGVAQNGMRAMLHYGQAATLGSETACCNLGLNFAKGLLGLDIDEAEARKWYEKMPGCAVKDCMTEGRDAAECWLRQH